MITTCFAARQKHAFISAHISDLARHTFSYLALLICCTKLRPILINVDAVCQVDGFGLFEVYCRWMMCSASLVHRVLQRTDSSLSGITASGSLPSPIMARVAL